MDEEYRVKEVDYIEDALMLDDDGEIDKWEMKIIRRAIWRYEIERKIDAALNWLGLGQLACKWGRHEMWLMLENHDLECTRCGQIRNLLDGEG